mgnify:CR=1 FL=1
MRIIYSAGNRVGANTQLSRFLDNIDKINKLYDEGNEITYWTARGTVTGFNWFKVTQQQLSKWGCKYHHLSVGYKPAYDLLICDKTKRIEEI